MVSGMSASAKVAQVKSPVVAQRKTFPLEVQLEDGKAEPLTEDAEA